MKFVEEFLKIYPDSAMRKRFFQEHFPLGKIGDDLLFADSEEKNNNLRQFLQDLITHSGLLTSDQDFILLPKKLSNNWYKLYKLLDWIKQRFNPNYSYRVLFFCWPEKMIEPADSTLVHWHDYDFRTTKYSQQKRSLGKLIEYVRHIYSNRHWRIQTGNQIALVGDYTFENLFSTANEKKGFDNLTRELDLESIYRRVCKSNVSEFVRIFFSEIDPKSQLKKSKLTTGRCFFSPYFTTKTTSGHLKKPLSGTRYFLGKKIIDRITNADSTPIGITLITEEFGGIYTPQGLCRIFPLGEKSSDNRYVSIREDSLIVPDRILAQNMLEAGRIALEQNYNLTQLSLEKLQSWVTGTYYCKILKPPELIFKQSVNFRNLPKNEWEKMMVDMVLKTQNGDKVAESIICEEYQNMVWRISRKYFCSGQNEWDLFQHGNMGLLIAIYDFDQTKNNVFTPFAIINIERTIIKIIKSARRIKRKAFDEALSLDASIGDSDNDNKSFSDFLVDKQAINPLTEIINKESYESLKKLMSYLSEILSSREMQVLTQLIIADTKRKPLTAIAKNLGITPKAVERTIVKIKVRFLKKIVPQYPHLATLICS